MLKRIIHTHTHAPLVKMFSNLDWRTFSIWRAPAGISFHRQRMRENELPSRQIFMLRKEPSSRFHRYSPNGFSCVRYFQIVCFFSILLCRLLLSFFVLLFIYSSLFFSPSFTWRDFYLEGRIFGRNRSHAVHTEQTNKQIIYIDFGPIWIFQSNDQTNRVLLSFPFAFKLMLFLVFDSTGRHKASALRVDRKI